jgi:CDP-diacylglycerol pyrophosphatase
MSAVMKRLAFACSLAAGVLLQAAPGSAVAAPRCDAPGGARAEALWRVVEGCVAGKTDGTLAPPCLQLDQGGRGVAGVLVLKDHSPRKPFEYLLIPTVRVDGVESAGLRAPAAPNYFDLAWKARAFLLRSPLLRRPLEPSWVVLALNSECNRSQNQLHIHIGCLWPAVAETLHGLRRSEGSWAEVDFRHASAHPYFVTWIRDLAAVNVVAKVAADFHVPQSEMGLETIVVAGAADGFFLLRADMEQDASADGEELIDPSCRIARRTFPGP